MTKRGTEAEGRRHKVVIQNAKFLHSSFCILPSSFPPAFSLIELVVIMVIVGILAMVAIIKFTGVDSQSNRIAANELRSHLTYVRNMAMNRERAMKVQFSSNSYEVWEAVTNLTGTYRRARDPVTQKDWTVDLNSKFPGVTPLAVNINGKSTLYFSETNGTPLGTNWVLLTNGIITFKSGLTVTIARETGYADLE